MKPVYDIIIVGAGPAGATLAHDLAIKGVGVLLLDKAEFPRYKCCGGGLTARAARLLGDGLTPDIENSISGLSLAFKGAGHYRRDYDEAIMYTVTREKFDHHLLQKAQQAGARVLTGTAAVGVKMTGDGIEVMTGGGSFRGRFVAGTDGSRGIVARAMGLENREYIVGIETEVKVGGEDMTRRKSRVLLDLGCIRKGYGWVFPKADHLSIGIACPGAGAKNLKRAYWQFVNSLKLNRYSISRWSAGTIPMCRGKNVVAGDRALLVGDAAGLADPLTGEGIYHAVLSARLAAPVIASSLSSNKNKLQDYQASVDEKIMPEIRSSQFFAKMLGMMPRRVFKLINTDDRVWRAGCSMLRGEISYVTLKKKIDNLGGLYSLLVHK